MKKASAFLLFYLLEQILKVVLVGQLKVQIYRHTSPCIIGQAQEVGHRTIKAEIKGSKYDYLGPLTKGNRIESDEMNKSTDKNNPVFKKRRKVAELIDIKIIISVFKASCLC